MSWNITDIVRSSIKGTTSLATTEDDVTSTTNRGQRTTTRTIPVKTSVTVKGVQENTGENTVTLNEDAGGNVSFRIPIRGGLFESTPVAVCPAP